MIDFGLLSPNLDHCGKHVPENRRFSESKCFTSDFKSLILNWYKVIFITRTGKVCSIYGKLLKFENII